MPVANARALRSTLSFCYVLNANDNIRKREAALRIERTVTRNVTTAG